MLECPEQIFEELHHARVAVVDAARISQGIYLWGMLRAWQIQQRYVSNNFQDDPVLTDIFFRQVLLHGQDVSLVDGWLTKISNGLKKLEDHDHRAQSDVKQLQREVKDLKSIVKEAKGKHPLLIAAAPGVATPQHAPLGEEVVEFLQDLNCLQKVHVTDVSESGWTWALALTQLGVRSIECVAFSELSVGYGRQEVSTLGDQNFEVTLRYFHDISFAPREGDTLPHVVCGHLLTSPSPAIVAFLCTAPITCFLL